jgi:ABC-type transport system involved in multi-copper enzyme maturation permease subunit
MLSGTTALLIRSLRADARLLRAHLFRLFFVCLIGGYLLLVTAMSTIFGAPGLMFFQWIAWLNFVLITLAAISFFATTVTEEKEEGTLGLLKMAGISRLGLLLGKSSTRLISALWLLLVQFPFTLLAITLGGVTMGQVVAVYVGLAAYMIFLANMALFCSVLCRRSGTAAALMTGLILGYFFLPGILTALMAKFSIGDSTLKTAVERLYDSSIIGRLGVILTTGFAESPFSFQVLSNLAAAAGWFVLSWAAFDLLTRERDVSAPYRGLPTGRRGPFALLRPSRTWGNALMWKDFHFVTGGVPWMTAKLIVYGLIVLLIAVAMLQSSNGPFRWDEFSQMVVGSMLAAMGAETSLYAARIFHDEVKWKTLSGVLMLPTSVGRIGWAKAGGCLLALGPAAMYLVAGAATSFETLMNLGVGLVSPSVWSVVLVFVVFLHVTALLSLYVKWGALPLAMAIMFIGNCLSSVFTLPLMLLMGGFGAGAEILALPIIAVLVGIIVGLQAAIGRRLQTVSVS